MNNIKLLVITFVIIEVFVSIFILRDLNRRIDTEIASKVNTITTQKEIIYNIIVGWKQQRCWIIPAFSALAK